MGEEQNVLEIKELRGCLNIMITWLNFDKIFKFIRNFKC